MEVLNSKIRETCKNELQIDCATFKPSFLAPIVDSWFLMSSELPLIVIIVAYLFTIKIIGPKFMKNRIAYELKNTLRFYNILQVASCASIVIQFHRAGWTYSSALSCESELPKENYLKILVIWWCCVFIRAAEFIETIFFILRRKDNQVTFLHVYHHVSSLFIVWFPLKYGGSKFCNDDH